MNNEAIIKDIIEVTAATLKERGVEKNEIDMNIPLSEEGLGLDSISRLTLLGNLENKFGIDFPEEYWGSKSFANLAAILAYIEKKNG